MPEAGDIPDDAGGTWMDSTSWLDMTGMNCTFTSETVGDLPLLAWGCDKVGAASEPERSPTR